MTATVPAASQQVCAHRQRGVEELKQPVVARKIRWHMKDVVDKGKKEKGKEMKLVFNGDIKKLKSEYKAI